MIASLEQEAIELALRVRRRGLQTVEAAGRVGLTKRDTYVLVLFASLTSKQPFRGCTRRSFQLFVCVNC